jgi:hypothetical protein
MRARILPLAALILLPLSARAEDPATPWDIRVPIRFGGGGTTMWGGSPGFNVSFGGVFIGRPLVKGVRPLLVLGFDSVTAEDDPKVILIDKDNGRVSSGFSQSLIQVETGFGVHLGGRSGPAGEIMFAPGATFIDTPGKFPAFKQDPITTVGLGLGWRAEIMPWWISMAKRAEDEGEEDEKPGFGSWMLASISFYVMARADFVEKNEGFFFGGGVAFDLGRIILGPLFRRFE